jgi:hypothetical protein
MTLRNTLKGGVLTWMAAINVDYDATKRMLALFHSPLLANFDLRKLDNKPADTGGKREGLAPWVQSEMHVNAAEMHRLAESGRRKSIFCVPIQIDNFAGNFCGVWRIMAVCESARSRICTAM